jgi:hypothetical protein
MEKDRFDEARVCLRNLHGTGSNDEFLKLEYREIRDSIAADRQAQKTSWKSLAANPAARRRLFLGCGVQFFCQTSGLNVINYYGTSTLFCAHNYCSYRHKHQDRVSTQPLVSIPKHPSRSLALVAPSLWCTARLPLPFSTRLAESSLW